MPAGAPVFGVQGLDALMLGGQWCALPNDTLARVAAYAPRTGVRWVVVRADRNALMEISLYSAEGASRYKRLAQYGPRPAESGLVRLSATTPEGETRLYEFTVSATR